MRNELTNLTAKFALIVFCLAPLGCSFSQTDSSWSNSLNMNFVRIEAGEFIQGSPLDAPLREENETPHLVQISRRFWIGATHVTVGQWAAFAKESGYQTLAEKQGWSYGAWNVPEDKWDKYEGGSWKSPGFEQGDNNPVVCVTWHDAVAFCEWLSEKEERTYRLPTEAEWEYTARGGTTTIYPWGNDPEDCEGWLNGSDESTASRNLYTLFPPFNWNDGYIYTSPVATFRANAFGLYDPIGNTLAWCSDWYGEYPKGPVKDPTGIVDGEQRILRGGGFVYGPDRSRSAFRGRNWPDFQNFYVGFRVLLESEGETVP
ncbi:formylglycine-generating enzyme family protein [Kriegella aquimaris]|uniref:Formylglycine-generating enzyme, required for sulfatase activity, contains SUMF1/FGE domain n=1 Tax=Kriegella aquimaris TaxID=192904 RepID=A0A1G9YMB7_9FLAO|nr:SUMF1/EgtB/PvdO family nonheme iron enzyme [Kriegella aquimaris]SDN10162.1 Formylglycine-generating enzyme, required for sulfatase activity, contains SUMF1/FGE domain [Kriegella aquimaris]